MKQFLVWGLMLGCVACWLGCDEAGIPKVPVSGKVTLNGQPVAGAIVAFNPNPTGRPASGRTDEMGIYRLTTDAQGDGALAGEYAVTIVKYANPVDEMDQKKAVQSSTGATSSDQPGSGDPYDITDEYPAGYDEMEESEKRASMAKNQMPFKYSDATRSPLHAQVQADVDDQVFDFQLTR